MVAPPAAPAAAAHPPTLTVEPIDPASSATVEFVRTTTLLEAPRGDAERLGVIRKQARAAVLSTAEGDPSCPRWIEIAPRGWACETAVVETTERPTAATPSSLTDDDGDAPAVIRSRYGMVRGGSLAFANRQAIQDGEGRALAGSNTVRAVGATTVEGKRYWLTSKGELIDADVIIPISPSTFKGVAITSGQLPAWVRGHGDPRKPVPTSATPGGRRTGALPPRAVVMIQEESLDGRFVRVDDDTWIPRRDLRIPTLTAPPEGTATDEKWFDVDLDQQVLVAYEGTRPVYATMVSTGKYGHYTPTLIARVASKHESTPMTSDKGDVYSVADVPWTMFYDGSYALHTSYWHDGFGGPRSHGCINLAPRDARALYQWSSPDVPPGWSSVYGTESHPGSLVRVRSSRRPDPAFRGYARAVHERSAAVASAAP